MPKDLSRQGISIANRGLVQHARVTLLSRVAGLGTGLLMAYSRVKLLRRLLPFA